MKHHPTLPWSMKNIDYLSWSEDHWVVLRSHESRGMQRFATKQWRQKIKQSQLRLCSNGFHPLFTGNECLICLRLCFHWSLTKYLMTAMVNLYLCPKARFDYTSHVQNNQIKSKILISDFYFNLILSSTSCMEFQVLTNDPDWLKNIFISVVEKYLCTVWGWVLTMGLQFWWWHDEDVSAVFQEFSWLRPVHYVIISCGYTADTLVPFFFLYTALTASPAALQNIRAAVAGPVQLLSITVNPGKASLHLVQ